MRPAFVAPVTDCVRGYIKALEGAKALEAATLKP